MLDSAEALRAADQPIEAIGKLEAALRLEGPLEASLVAEIRLRLADCHTEANNHAAALTAVAPVLQRGPDEIWRARAHIRVARAKCYLGDVEASAAESRAALGVLAGTSLHDETAMALQWLGNALQESGNIPAAGEAFRDAVALARLSRDSFRLASGLGSLARLNVQRSRYREAKREYEECATLAEALGQRREVARVHLNLSVCLVYLGEWAAADRALGRAQRLFSELDDLRGMALCMLALCRLARRRRQDPTSFLSEATEYAEKSEYRRARLLALEERADIAREGGDLARAEEEYEKLLQLSGPEAPGGDISYEVRSRLALVRLARGRATEAKRLAAEALDEARRACDLREEAFCLTVLARIERTLGSDERAARDAEEAIRILERIDVPYELAQACDVVDGILPRGRFRERARALYESLGLETAGPDADRSAKERFVAASARTTRLVETARRLATVRTPLMLTGETGVGKALLARLIHESGSAPPERFAVLNCATWSERRVEGGRAPDPTALFASAAGGTVVLRSIDRASRALQELLGGALDGVRIEGATLGDEVCGTRVISTTSAHLERLVEERRFLKDLYYRLTGLVLAVPPLRERLDDIDALARRLTQQELPDDVLAALREYPWPGNVRELENALRAALFAAGEAAIGREHLPASVTAPRSEARTLPERIELLERREIRSALERVGNNKRVAARSLGISRKGLIDRLKRLGLWEEYGKRGPVGHRG